MSRVMAEPELRGQTVAASRSSLPAHTERTPTMRSDIAPGGTFPDYELPDHASVPRRLSELQGDDPLIPHTLVLKPGLVIHSIYNGYWFWGRPSIHDLWHDLRAATREIRPDWDLGAPGLGDAWNAGDLSAFHGWDRPAPSSPSAA